MYLKKTTKKELLDAYARYCRGGISKKKLGKELGLSEPTTTKKTKTDRGFCLCYPQKSKSISMHFRES